MTDYLYCPRCGTLVHQSECSEDRKSHALGTFMTAGGIEKQLTHFGLMEED